MLGPRLSGGIVAGVNLAFDPHPTLLSGRLVRLEPLQRSHAAGLFAAGQDPEIWRYMMNAAFATVTEATQWIEAAQAAQAAGTELAFATVRQSDGRVVGSTRFLDIRRPNRALEIGSTWIAREAQRSGINTEAKSLMLRHAFENLGAVRVQLKTDERNQQSRAAIARLGASFEGILRNYQTYPLSGFVRNTAMFSIVYGVLLRPLPYHDPARLMDAFSSSPAPRAVRLYSRVQLTSLHTSPDIAQPCETIARSLTSMRRL